MTRNRKLIAALSAALLGVAVAVSATASAGTTPEAAPAATHHTGTLPNGTVWIADVPADWHGPLVLYSHGFGGLTAADAPNPATAQALLARGYALVGSSYDPNGSLWALGNAVDDQFASLAAIEKIIGTPTTTLALGTSMGGLVSALEAERSNGRLDGVMSTCGLVGGGLNLTNYQLDGEYALNQLLAPGQPVKLVNYAQVSEAATAAAQLTELATTAQATAAGRARVALASSLMNMPTWSDGQTAPPAADDAAGLARGQYEWLIATLRFTMPARFWIEQAAGGNGSFNAGVNYAALIAKSPYRDEVKQLYRAAGLDLGADLKSLTRNAAVRADADAVDWLTDTSVPTGKLDVPVLNMHGSYDQLNPVEYETQYAATVRRAGDSALLRQAYIARRGHCTFTVSEIIAGLQAVEHRVATGRWGAETTTPGLQAASTALNLADNPAFVDFRPGTFVNERRFRPSYPGS